MVYLNIELPEMVWPDARNLQINLAEGLLNISATIGAGPQIYQMNVHLRDRATLYVSKVSSLVNHLINLMLQISS